MVFLRTEEVEEQAEQGEKSELESDSEGMEQRQETRAGAHESEQWILHEHVS